MFYGFNLGRLIKQRRPRKPFSQKTGLFDRELKDELIEDYHKNQKYTKNVTSIRITQKSKKRSSYSGFMDHILEIIIAVLIIILVISILSKLNS